MDGGILREREGIEAQRAMEMFFRACVLDSGRGCTKAGLALQTGLSGDPDPEAAVTSMELGCAKGWAAGCGLAASECAWAARVGIGENNSINKT